MARKIVVEIEMIKMVLKWFQLLKRKTFSSTEEMRALPGRSISAFFISMKTRSDFFLEYLQDSSMKLTDNFSLFSVKLKFNMIYFIL